MNIRRARPEEAQELTDIALRAKAYWGYDAAFLEACRDALTVTEAKIRQHHVYLASDGVKIAGFYCLIVSGETGVLDDMFIDPPYIRTGLGRALWEHLITLAKETGVSDFTIDADPNAEEFYLKMGAIRVGEAPSSAVPGRMLPLMRVMVGP